MGGGRRPVARPRAAGPARGRRLDHAANDLGQSQRLDLDDRRPGLRHDPRQGRAGGGAGLTSWRRFGPVQRVDRDDTDRARNAWADLAFTLLLLFAEAYFAMIVLAVDAND